MNDEHGTKNGGGRPASNDDGLQWTGRFAGGLIDDLKRRLPHYVDDFRQGIHTKVLGSTFFLYFACLANAIAFGALTGFMTDGQIGTTEMMVATAVGGVTFALLSGQPLTILGGTGPIVIYTALLYQTCNSMELEFLPVYAWVGVWSGILLMVLAVTDASALMRLFTRFTDEIFAALIAVIFIVEAGKDIAKGFSDPNTPHDAALLGLVLAMGTFLLARTLQWFRNSQYLRWWMRDLLGGFWSCDRDRRDDHRGDHDARGSTQSCQSTRVFGTDDRPGVGGRHVQRARLGLVRRHWPRHPRGRPPLPRPKHHDSARERGAPSPSEGLRLSPGLVRGWSFDFGSLLLRVAVDRRGHGSLVEPRPKFGDDASCRRGWRTSRGDRLGPREPNVSALGPRIDRGFASVLASCETCADVGFVRPVSVHGVRDARRKPVLRTRALVGDGSATLSAIAPFYGHRSDPKDPLPSPGSRSYAWRPSGCSSRANWDSCFRLLIAMLVPIRRMLPKFFETAHLHALDAEEEAEVFEETGGGRLGP